MRVRGLRREPYARSWSVPPPRTQRAGPDFTSCVGGCLDEPQLRSFAEAVSRPVSWIVEEVIPANTVTLISSVSGAGKSILAINLAVCVLTGAKWIGVTTKQGGVALWDQDNPDAILTDNRIAAVAAGLDTKIESLSAGLVFRLGRGVIANPEGVKRLRDILHRRGVTLLIVDTLAAVNPWDEQGVEFSRVITDGMFPFVEAGITPLVLHHIGKPSTDQKGQKHHRSGIEAARGHSSLVASVGAAYNLMLDGSTRYLVCVKPRYGERPNITLTYDEDGAMGQPDWRITIGSPRVSLSQQNLTHLIITNGWTDLSSRELVKKVALNGFSISQSTAARALSESR